MNEKKAYGMCLSEHPFGTVKRYNEAHYLLCRGKTKTAAELGLRFLAYYPTRAIHRVGVESLIAAMGGTHFFNQKQANKNVQKPALKTSFRTNRV